MEKEEVVSATGPEAAVEANLTSEPAASLKADSKPSTVDNEPTVAEAEGEPIELKAVAVAPASEAGSSDTAGEMPEDDKKAVDEKPQNEFKNLAKERTDYPEGGLTAWLVVFGAFLVHFFGISLIYITGVFIREFYYSGVFPGATYAQLSWISSGIGISLPILAPAYGYAITRLGPRVVVMWGGLCLGVGFELASLSNETWQIVLTLGVICGIGQSSLWVAAVSTVVQWFLKRRGLVVGIVAAGTGLGGLALAPMAQSLIDHLGWRNALRVLGAVVGSTVMLGSFLLYTRFGDENRVDLRFWRKKDPIAEAEAAAKKAEKKKEPYFDRAFFKNPTFIKLYMFGFVQPFAFLFPYTVSCPKPKHPESALDRDTLILEM